MERTYSCQAGGAEARSQLLHEPEPYVESQLRDSLSSSSRTACQRCRDQKLKCSRDHPACSRCSRQQLLCAYPLPPNRKLIASSRKMSRLRDPDLHTRRRGKQTNQAEDRSGYSHHSSALLQHSRSNRRLELLDNIVDAEAVGSARGVDDMPYITSHQRPLFLSHGPRISPALFSACNPKNDQTLAETAAPFTNSSESSISNLASLPPRAIGLSLLEVYFERVSNASLLFHKPTLFRDYIEDKLSTFLLRSIFALASLFLREKNAPHNGGKLPFELSTFGSFYKSGRHWAQAASQEVLTLADRPSLTMCQSLQCLTLYWFANGQLDRADIHLTLAYRACSILRYDQLRDFDHAPTSVLNMDHESKRRCFWACWTSLCIASEPRAYAASAWSEVANLPLPSTFRSSGPTLDSLVCQRMDADWRCSIRGRNSVDHDKNFIWAEIMKIVGVWVKIQLLAIESLSHPEDGLLHRMASLSRTLESICQSETFSPWMGHCSKNDEMRELRIFLASVCHVCHIILHAATAPSFFARSPNVARTSNSSHDSGDTTLKHAAMVGRMLQEYLSTDPDLTKLSPLVGYVAFVSGSVLVISAKSHTDRGSNSQSKSLPPDSRYIESCLVTLDTLRNYWQPLQRLWKMLRRAVLAMNETIPPCMNHQESCLDVNQGRCQSPQHIATLEEQGDISFISTRYFSKTRQDSVSHTAPGTENLSERGTFGNDLMPQLGVNSAEQAVHQDGLLTSAPVPHLEAGANETSRNGSMAESAGENDWLQYLLADGWQEGNGMLSYEPLVPLEQQPY